MGIRVLAIATFASIALAAALGILLVRVEAKQPPLYPHARSTPSSSLAAQVAAQGRLIKQLQTQVAALQHGSSISRTAQAHVRSGVAKTRKVPDITHKLKLADNISPGLQKLKTQHSHFIGIWHGGITPYPIFTKGPTQLQQLQAQVAQLSTQVSQLSSQVGSVQNEVVFDENLLGEEILNLQKNLTSVANSVPVLPPGQGFCGGNGGMSWGGIKQIYLNSSGLDNAFFCYLLQ